jgi:peptidoglycan/LPS O-acetylase OafA/YrhL
MKRKSGGCCSGCLWLFAIALLIYSWEGSGWALRAVELLLVAVVVIAAAIYQQRRRSRSLESRGSVSGA